jgi:hypothetical protein
MLKLVGSLIMLVKLITGELVESIFGGVITKEVYCWTFFYLSAWYVIYFALNGLSIAVVRLIYLKAGTWLKYNFGEMKLLGLTGIAVILSSIIFTLMFGSETSSNRSVYNMCTGHSHNFQVNILNIC